MALRRIQAMSIVPRVMVKLRNGDEKCPYCGTVFGSPSMHPFDVAVREEFRKRRSKAAKKGWAKRRKNGLPHGQDRKRRAR